MLIPVVLAGTVTRSVDNPSPNSGDTVEVTLTVSAVSGDKAILIHEEAPFDIIGLSNNIYETAIIDQIQVQSTTKIYTFIAGAIGAQSFSGVYTINGEADQTIAGVSSITIGGTCTDSTWTPLPSTVCSGDSFTQTSNCGNTRTETGTMDCGSSVCGNGVLESGETCDDSNTDSGDGCSSSCQTETTTTTDSDCEFWEKEKDGECELNVAIIILVVIGLFAFKMVTG